MMLAAAAGLVAAETVPGNLAKGKNVYASSFESNKAVPEFAVDGNNGTRWSSKFSDPQWLYVDLGGMYRVTGLAIRWESAFAREYKIQFSDDGLKWVDVFHQTDGKGGNEAVLPDPQRTRYVRLMGIKRATPYGYSVWEMTVQGQ